MREFIERNRELFNSKDEKGIIKALNSSNLTSHAKILIWALYCLHEDLCFNVNLLEDFLIILDAETNVIFSTQIRGVKGRGVQGIKDYLKSEFLYRGISLPLDKLKVMLFFEQ